jgi:HEAT repeat protein
MPRKKTPSKSSASRFTSAPSKAKETKAAEIPVTSPQAKQPAAAATTAPTRVESPATALIAALRQSDADVARDAATSLGALGDASAVQPLIEALENNDGYFHPVVRAAAAHSLGRLNDRRAVEALLRAVRDTHTEPSAEAIRALAVIGDTRAIPGLIEVVRNSAGFFLPTARLAAVGALARFQLDERAATELLTVSANNWEDPVIRQAAVQATESPAKNRA